MEKDNLRVNIKIAVTREFSYYPILAERETTIVAEQDVAHSLAIGKLAQSMKWSAVKEALAKLEEGEIEADDEMPE